MATIASTDTASDFDDDDDDDEMGVSLREMGDARAADEVIEDGEIRPEDESFLLHNNKLSMPTVWSPCRLLLSLLMVFVLCAVAIYTVISLDQQWQQQQPPPILRFHAPAPPVSSLLQQNDTPQSDWTFRIMQITDIHLGEDEYTEWGPEQDVKTFRLLDKMFAYEQPHLVVMGGDQLTANNCQHNCTEYYKMLGRYLTLQGIPWATVLGNHDDMDFEPYHDQNMKTLPHEYTRRDLLKVDESFHLSLTQTGPVDVTGASNYVLDVMGPSDDNEPVLQIFFLDSGGGTLPETDDDSQVEWFRQKSSIRNDLPAVAFQHIPTRGHLFDVETCTGFQGQHIDDLYYVKLVDVMVESGRFNFLGVGHTHGNDYCCPYHRNDGGVDEHDLYFCFGRHSGYGGYGNWQRGVRMYEIMLSAPKVDNSKQAGQDMKRELKWRTWVRLESGAYVDFLDYDHKK